MGRGVEFADYRPYQVGDDFRYVDWNIYSRLDRLFIKLFSEEEDINVHLFVDTSHSMDWGEPSKLAYALRLAAAQEAGRECKSRAAASSAGGGLCVSL